MQSQPPLFEGISDNVRNAVTQIRQADMLRLVEQFLNDNGFNNALQALQEESGVSLEDDHTVLLRKAIEAENWYDGPSNAYTQIRESIPFLSEVSRQQALLMCTKLRYGQLVRSGEIATALSFLETVVAPSIRNDRTPHDVATDTIARLYMLLLIGDPERFETHAQEVGASMTAESVTDALSKLMAPGTLIGPQRLPRVIAQALQHQVEQNKVHFGPIESYSPLVDFTTTKQAVFRTIVESFQLDGEVYCVANTSDGCTVCVGTSGGEVTVFQHTELKGWQRSFDLPLACSAVCSICMARNDDHVLVGMKDGSIYNIDLHDRSYRYTGTCRATVTCIIPFSTGYLIGTPIGLTFANGTDTLDLSSVDSDAGDLLEVQDIVPGAGNTVFVMTSRRVCKVQVIPARPLTFNKVVDAGKSSALAVSGDGKLVAATFTDRPMALYDTSLARIGELSGHVQTKFVLKPSFVGDAGKRPTCVAVGSEDGSVVVYSLALLEVVQRVAVHSTSCNGVRYLPPLRQLVSFGDDGRVMFHGMVG